jgi:3',5'-cyclic AMP phosphodiesterase CpdA
MFSLAHLSDPHLPVPETAPGTSSRLTAKRLSCLLSWKTKRKDIHRPEVLAALLKDVDAARPDHIAVTGDLINISLPREFAAAQTWLAALGSPERVTVVPGNHDLLADDLSWQQSFGLWDGYMRGDERREGAAPFPFVRRRGAVALVGLSSAVPTPLFRAGGRLGQEQIAAAEQCLAGLGKEGACRVVLLHHPPVAPRRRIHSRKMLRDHAPFRAAIARSGAELILHGHSHRFGLSRIEREDGRYAPVLSVPSGSALGHADGSAAGWNLYRFDRERDGTWRIEVSSRGLTPTGEFAARGRFSLVLNSAS